MKEIVKDVYVVKPHDPNEVDCCVYLIDTKSDDGLILIERTNKPRPVIESLISPYKLVSLNEIFLATGDKQFRAVLWEEDKANILFTKEELEELIFELTGNITRVEFQ